MCQALYLYYLLSVPQKAQDTSITDEEAAAQRGGKTCLSSPAGKVAEQKLQHRSACLPGMTRRLLLYQQSELAQSQADRQAVTTLPFLPSAQAVRPAPGSPWGSTQAACFTCSHSLCPYKTLWGGAIIYPFHRQGNKEKGEEMTCPIYTVHRDYSLKLQVTPRMDYR